MNNVELAGIVSAMMKMAEDWKPPSWSKIKPSTVDAVKRMGKKAPSESTRSGVSSVFTSRRKTPSTGSSKPKTFKLKPKVPMPQTASDALKRMTSK